MLLFNETLAREFKRNTLFNQFSRNMDVGKKFTLPCSFCLILGLFCIRYLKYFEFYTNICNQDEIARIHLKTFSENFKNK